MGRNIWRRVLIGRCSHATGGKVPIYLPKPYKSQPHVCFGLSILLTLSHNSKASRRACCLNFSAKYLLNQQTALQNSIAREQITKYTNHKMLAVAYSSNTVGVRQNFIKRFLTEYHQWRSVTSVNTVLIMSLQWTKLVFDPYIWCVSQNITCTKLSSSCRIAVAMPASHAQNPQLCPHLCSVL